MGDELPPEFANLGKELQCPICLGIFSTPCGRLPCCHYFCLECITESLKHKTACPTCKMFARKRDLMRDSKIDRIASLYKQLEAACGSFLLCSQPVGQQPQGGDTSNAQPMLAQGAEDDLASRFLAGPKNQSPFVVPSPPASPGDDEYETAREEGLEVEEHSCPGPVTEGHHSLPLYKWRGPLTPEATQLTQMSNHGGEDLPPSSHQDATEQSLYLPSRQMLSQGCVAKEGVEKPPLVPPHSSTATDCQNLGVIATLRAPLADLSNGCTEGNTGKQRLHAEKEGGLAQEAPVETLNGSIDTMEAKGDTSTGTSNAPYVPLKNLFSAMPEAKPAQALFRKRCRRSTAIPCPPATPAPSSEGVAQPSADFLAPPSTGRRVPSRLLPWTCQICTLVNTAATKKCAACETLKDSGPESISIAAAAEEEAIRRYQSSSKRSTHKKDNNCSNANMAKQKGKMSTSCHSDIGATMMHRGRGIDSTGMPNATALSEEHADNAARGGEDVHTKGIKGIKRLNKEAEPHAGYTGHMEHPMKGLNRLAAGFCKSKEVGSRKHPGNKSTNSKRKRSKKAPVISKEQPDNQHAPETAGPLGKAVYLNDLSSLPPKTVRQSHGLDSRHFPVWKAPKKRDWVILSSGITDEQDKESLSLLVSLSGAQTVSDWDHTVTHIVCGTNAENCAKRTFKFLLGVLQGSWIVSMTWARECLLACKPIPEEAFEVCGAIGSQNGGPAEGRARRQEGAPRLLEGRDIVLSGSFENTKNQICAIILAAGGRLLPRIPADSDEQDRKAAPIVICDASSKGPRSYGRRRQGVVLTKVSLSWLMDSVACHRLQSIELYRRQ